MTTALNAVPVVAIFPSRSAAEGAVQELWQAGFRHQQIGMASPGEDLHEAGTRYTPAEKQGGDGAVVGAVTGGGVGALLGMAVTLIPGIGPILAGGLLTGLALGTTAGAAAGAYLGPFVALGIAEPDAVNYGKELKAGRTVVVVQTEDQQSEAATILGTYGPLIMKMPPKE